MVRLRWLAGFDGGAHLTMVYPDDGVKDMKVIGMQPISVKTLI